MASMRRACWTLWNTAIPRRSFTTGTALRSHPTGIPNDTLPFFSGKESVNKGAVTVCYIIFCSTGLMWPILAARDQSIRIGLAVEDPSDS